MHPLATRSQHGRAERRVLIYGGVIVTIWVLMIAVGFRALIKYEATAAPLHIPAAATPPPDTAGKIELVMALHPQCPCSVASVAELTKIYSHATRPFAIKILAYRPKDETDSWIESSSLKQARELKPEVVVDIDGAEARRLGMHTSGEVALFDATGKLIFRGGITGARGHRGDNLGEQAALALINGTTSPRASAPVFGCSLF